MFVCKSWFSLITNIEFSKFYRPKSVPLLAFYEVESDDEESSPRPNAYSLFEVEEGLDLELYFNPVTKVNLPDNRWLSIHGSANGLLFLLDNKFTKHEVFLICNPITREYVKLQFPQTVEIEARKRTRKLKNHKRKLKKNEFCYGFGASKITGQLKVVKFFWEWKERDNFECDCERYDMFPERRIMSRKHRCEVYTLGTGSWRRITLAPTYYGGRTNGSFLNGNLHWLVEDKKGCSWISCFDLEEELFSTFSTPKLTNDRATSLGTLGYYLCLCENRYGVDINIWLMKEYGVEKSWTKEFVIGKNSQFKWNPYNTFYPIKFLNDGVFLIGDYGRVLVQYSKKNGSFLVQSPAKKGISLYLSCIVLFRHTLNFLSLKHLGMENVRSLNDLTEIGERMGKKVPVHV